MQHLENDMDDLFQRAAENYPLKPGKGDWESVAKKMSESTNAVSPVKRNTNKKLIALLLLLIISAAWFIFQTPKTVIKGNELVSSKTDNKKPREEIKNNNSPVTEKEVLNIASLKKNKSARKIIRSQGNSSIHVSNTTPGIVNYNERRDKNELNDGQVIAPANERSSLQPEDLENPGNRPLESLQNNEGTPSVNDNEKANTNPGNDLKKNDQAIPAKTKKKGKPTHPETQGLYFGVVAGLDFSKVQSTSFNNSGFDAGILLGFRINSKFSIESGLIFNKKNYKSEGKNFDMKKVGSTMPTGMIVNSLESRSSILEIPVKVKYNIISYSKSAFFISGGVSAYVMTKEKNHYNVTFNGTQEKLTGTYEKNDYELPAVANISVGYQHKIANYMNIRVEPFLKIPLRGMGVGSLPVTSAGLQVGIIRRF